jgi:predicted TIM-barrel fold metal-dependent hydrolase
VSASTRLHESPTDDGSGLTFVDADGHVLEPASAMVDFAPPGFEDRVWRIEADESGAEILHMDDMEPMDTAVMALAGTAGVDEERRRKMHSGEFRYSDLPDHCWDAEARLAVLDADGISHSVLHATMLLGFQSLRTHEFVAAQSRTFNDWLSDLCARGRGRLHGVANLPQRDPEAAAAEIRRVADLPGIVGVQLRPNPAADGYHFNHPMYDPIWRACSETGLPLGFHPLLAADLPGAIRGMRLNRLGTSEIPVQDQEDFGSDNIYFAQALGNPADMMNTVMFLTGGGVLQRFPDLRCVFLESNGGWIVPLLERLDHHARIYEWDVPWLGGAMPSEFFRRQCWISFDADESTLCFTANSDMVGADRIVWASDFPHPDAKYPGTTAELAENLAPLSVADQQRVAGLNAVELYGIDLG